MKKVLLAIIAFALLQGCSGVSKKIIHADNGVAYKLEEVYSIGLFTPTYQWKRTSICKTEKKLINKTKHGKGYETVSIVEPCKVIGRRDGFSSDVASPVGPALMQVGSTVGAGALIQDGLKDSGDNISNTNQQKQGQIQGQAQGVIVRGGGCRGNCN